MIQNVWAICRDPKIFPDPEAFNPVSRHNFVERTDTSLAETTLSNIQGQFPNQSYQSSKTPILKPAAKSSGRFLSLPNVSKPLPTSS